MAVAGELLALLLLVAYIAYLYVGQSRPRRGTKPAAHFKPVTPPGAGRRPSRRASLPASPPPAVLMLTRDDGGMQVEVTVGAALATALANVEPQVLEQATTLVLRRELADAPLAGLARFERVHTLKVVGAAPLSKAALVAISLMPALRQLDLRGCRAVVDSNNSAAGMCNATDLYVFHGAKRLAWLALPPVCALEIGTCVKNFPKANVCVVELPRDFALRLNDRIAFRRRDGLTIWTSAPTVVTSIRTDAHDQLEQATDGQFAILVAEPGRRGDTLLWLGCGDPDNDAHMPADLHE